MLLYFGEKIMKGILQYPVEIISMTYKQFCEETGSNENPFINSQTPGFKIIRSDIENENIYWEPEYRRSRFDRHALKQTSIEHE